MLPTSISHSDNTGFRYFTQDQGTAFDPTNEVYDDNKYYQDLSKLPLAKGRRKVKGQQAPVEYERTLQVTPDMKSLINIVAALQKDVKRINSCITKDGADQWIAKTNKKNWQSHEADITGPDNKPDGIDEVFVTDGNGNIRVINGYGLSTGKYPDRKVFYSAFPDPSDRKKFNKSAKDAKLPTGMARYNQLMNDFTYDGKGVKYDFNYPEGREFGIAQKKRNAKAPSPKDIFTQYMFAPFYERNKDTVSPLVKNLGRGLGQFYLQASNALYDAVILTPTLAKHGINSSSAAKDIAKAKKDASFKSDIMDAVNVEYNKLYANGTLKPSNNTAISTFVNESIGPIFNYVLSVMKIKRDNAEAETPAFVKERYPYQKGQLTRTDITDSHPYGERKTIFVPNSEYLDHEDLKKKDLN